MQTLKSLYTGLSDKHSKGFQESIVVPLQFISILNKRQYILLITETEQVFYERNKRIIIDNDRVLLYNQDGKFKKYDLVKLAEICIREEERKWPEIIKRYFFPNDSSEKREYILRDFSLASQYLSIRIYPENFVDRFQLDEFVYRIDIEKTMSMLVLDLPYSVEGALKLQLKQWNTTEKELFEIAIRNLKENYKPEIKKTIHGLYAFAGNNFFITSNILFLDNFPECIGNHGALVALPTKGFLICKPIEIDIDVEVGLQIMLPFSHELYMHDDHPITKEVYWYYQGKYHLINSGVDGIRLNYVLPAKLENLLY